MIGQTAFVQDLGPSGETPKEQSIDVTLAELGYKDITVSGTGLREIYFSFDLPLGWSFTNEAYVRLLFTHSPLLDPNRSAITMFFNTTPIASVALDESNATAGELVGPLPAKSSRPGRANTLLVRVDAHAARSMRRSGIERVVAADRFAILVTPGAFRSRSRKLSKAGFLAVTLHRQSGSERCAAFTP